MLVPSCFCGLKSSKEKHEVLKEKCMFKSNYETQILVNGQPVKEFAHKSKFFIEGRKDTEFEIKIKNNGFKRILAVPTVDGLSVLDGKPADYDSSGYIINGYDAYTIKGWRISNKEVAKFIFCDKNKSYAAKSKENGNQGVIGVAIFKEREEPSFFSHSWPSPFFSFTNSGTDIRLVADYTTSMCCSESSNGIHNEEMDLGTGWGDTKHDTVQSVGFKREGSPDAVFEIYYASLKTLEKMGIDTKTKPHYISAFPGRFCQPPEEN